MHLSVNLFGSAEVNGERNELASIQRISTRDNMADMNGKSCFSRENKIKKEEEIKLKFKERKKNGTTENTNTDIFKSSIQTRTY